MIPNCQETAHLVSEGLDRDLSRLERIGLRLHLALCGNCRRFRRQVGALRRALPRLLRALEENRQVVLPPEARERLRGKLAE
jgi:predicted anti-sigma-YlaC factor YlaD